MPLPSIAVPHYFLQLPSTKEKIKYRPFLVKEEKILLIALESEEQQQMVNAVKEIIFNCTYEKLDVAKLAMFDVEYVFLQIRAKSKGEELKLKFQCPQCQVENELVVDLLKVKVKENDEHSNKIEINEEVGIIMKYPSIDSAGEFSTKLENKGKADQLFDIIKTSIDSVYDKETTYKPSDYTKEELYTFIEGLPENAFLKIQTFFETMPKLRENKKYKCEKCSYEEEVTLEGLQNFLG